MRIGAIFARGSCRALKWMALFGVVFALGAGSAAAQLTFKPTTADKKKVAEGSSLDITVTVKAWRGATDAQAATSVTVTATAATANATTRASTTEPVSNEAADIVLNPGTATLSFGAEAAGATGRQVTKTGTITLQTTHDPDAEDEAVRLTFALSTGHGLVIDAADTALEDPAGAAAVLAVTIDDDEEQKYVLTVDSGETPKEGGSFDLTIKADPPFVHGKKDVRLHLSDSMYSLTTPADGAVMLGDQDATNNTDATDATGRATDAENMAGIVIKAPTNDKNRSEDTLTIKALDVASSKELGMLDVKVADSNPLPAIKVMVVDDEGMAVDPQPTSLMEGDSVKIMATAVDKDGDDMKAAEDLTVSLMPQAGMGMAGMRDYSLSMHPITIASGKTSSAAVTLMAESDDEVDMETLTLDASVAGDSTKGSGTRDVMGVLSLMIEDDTDKLVWAKTQKEVEDAIYGAKEAGMGADEKFNPGEMIEIMGGALFNAAEGVVLSYTAMSDHDHVATTSVGGGMVTVTAGHEEGMAHITITAHASMPSSVKIADQSDPAEASIMFPVDVMMEALTLTLMGPEDMNVAEGMSAEVTVMANRAVTEDMEIMLMRDRAMSSATDEDFTADSIMLMAGEEMATGMVMAVEDEMAEDMEELVLYAMAGDMEVMGTAKLYIWDAAVPALPIVAQLLLAAFLGFGGYRRYRRR